jgi:hypothetical protein
MLKVTRKQWYIVIAILVVAVIAGLLWWALHPRSQSYQVVSISAHSFFLPIIGAEVRGTPDAWDLYNGEHVKSLASQSGHLVNAHGYLTEACGARNGTVTHWIWRPHHGHQEAIIQLAHCSMGLERIAHPSHPRS